MNGCLFCGVLIFKNLRNDFTSTRDFTVHDGEHVDVLHDLHRNEVYICIDLQEEDEGDW